MYGGVIVQFLPQWGILHRKHHVLVYRSFLSCLVAIPNNGVSTWLFIFISLAGVIGKTGRAISFMNPPPDWDMPTSDAGKDRSFEKYKW
jgi:hypothetical protein